MFGFRAAALPITFRCMEDKNKVILYYIKKKTREQFFSLKLKCFGGIETVYQHFLDVCKLPLNSTLIESEMKLSSPIQHSLKMLSSFTFQLFI